VPSGHYLQHMNDLATIQKVINVRKHPNADALDLVQVLGWQVVTKRDEFKEGDLVVYIAIDTVVPERAEFEFLRDKKFRIKPVRLRGEESAGICFPLTILNGNSAYGAIEGLDVTETLGVIHYEKPMPAELAGMAHGGLPGFLIMTDEKNLRTYPEAVPELWGRPYYITQKDDGSSGTFFIRNGEFGVTSRQIHLKESETNGFWRMARKYDIEKHLRTQFPDVDIAIQGEVVGPGVQGNKLGLKEMEFHFFNLFEIVSRRYLEYGALCNFAGQTGIPMVKVIEEGSAFHYTLEELVKLSLQQTYLLDGGKTNPAEGIVIRPKESFTSQVLKKSWSGKVLNPLFEEEKAKKKK
jgi:RNA ligase (TIGR02306 family)